MNKKIDKAEYEKRINRITDLFKDMIVQADRQSLARCPYKNRLDQCTAKFCCQNKRKPRAEGELSICACKDGLDYRTAWESDPEAYAHVRQQLKEQRSSQAS